jgi:hypothetical protein
MSVYIDRAFLLRISAKLPRFAQKKDDLYNFRCPLCGDSQKNKTKCRGYIYRKKNDYFYMCHNCGASTNFYNFLEKVEPTLIKEYALERYKDGSANNSPKPTFFEAKIKPIFREKIDLPSIESLSEEHFAREYVTSRQIPRKFWSQLYFAEDFKKFAEDNGIHNEGLKTDDQRLVIPFFDKKKELVAFQGRALGKSPLRYITLKTHNDNNKVYGLDRIDEDKTIYVTEGPIDSMFLDNAVATADSNLESIGKLLDKTKVVLVFDNEPRNKEICHKIDKAIDNHFQVVIWPEMVEAKDINDMILDGLTSEDIQDIIESNTFVNLRAKAEFVNWKKI